MTPGSGSGRPGLTIKPPALTSGFKPFSVLLLASLTYILVFFTLFRTNELESIPGANEGGSWGLSELEEAWRDLSKVHFSFPTSHQLLNFADNCPSSSVYLARKHRSPWLPRRCSPGHSTDLWKGRGPDFRRCSPRVHSVRPKSLFAFPFMILVN